MNASQHRPRLGDQQTATIIGHVLRIGVLAAGSLVLAGAVVYLWHHGCEYPQYGAFRGEPADLRTVSGIVADAFQLRGRGLIQLGLLLLIATPVLRVAIAGFAFALQRDHLYVAVSLIVLTSLVYSMLVGIL
jgi:uncharacterized membrane protein